MEYVIFNKNIVTIWDGPSKTQVSKDGVLQSAIADEGLYGMGAAVTGEAENGFYPVCTHYGYAGYVKAEEIRRVTAEELQAWENSALMAVSGICVDVTSIPKVQGVVYESLYRGALLKVLEFDSEEKGWAKVELADGRTGYLRNQFLTEKKYSQAGLWENELPQSFLEKYRAALAEGRDDSAAELEADFREAVVRTALTYLGVQYRWGGKSTAGLDCSGLTSVSYMLNGVLTYRDAQIKAGFPVHEILQEQMKKGDLLYFPGHIAMYIGDHRYIHSTGKTGSGGVVINSLNPLDEDYREDLVKCLSAVGSIF